MDNSFLQENQDNLKEILKPFQQELKQGQRLADFIKKCIRSAERDDFLQLDELLNSKLAKDAELEEKLSACKPFFDDLRVYSREQVEKYRLEFIEDLTRLGEEANLTIEIDFPRISLLKGIYGEIDFAARTTTINKKVLKSIDPRRIVTALTRLKKQLYGRPFDPQAYIDSLHETYVGISQKENLAAGTPVPIYQFYLEYVISLQSVAFFSNLDKSKFRGYSLEQFGVDIWRYCEAGIGGTTNGMQLKLGSGRKSLWLIDHTGERRQIGVISFLKKDNS
ncbi:hypothetical protein KAI46_04895 [bacterium]|nr:hypothetical protein [bacterium]